MHARHMATHDGIDCARGRPPRRTPFGALADVPEQGATVGALAGRHRS
jgi:hypothetical protein